MDPIIVMFFFRTASLEPSICLDFVIEVMGIQGKFCIEMACIYYVIKKTSY